jgi:hypothetical protein
MPLHFSAAHRAPGAELRASVQVSKAAYDDGLLELYALTKGALAPGWTSDSVPEHTLRLGQGSAVRLCIQGDNRRAAKAGSKRSHSDADAAVFMLVDGEAWWQEVPTPASVSKTMSASDAFAVRILFVLCVARAGCLLISCASSRACGWLVCVAGQRVLLNATLQVCVARPYTNLQAASTCQLLCLRIVQHIHSICLI